MAANGDPEPQSNDAARADADRSSTEASDKNPGQSDTDRLFNTGEELIAKWAAAAARLFRQGRTALADNQEFADATRELRKAVKSNPLGAVAIAIAAGFVLALLTRG
jgi:hypothetical protein